jgi:hypothetical protein
VHPYIHTSSEEREVYLITRLLVTSGKKNYTRTTVPTRR